MMKIYAPLPLYISHKNAYNANECKEYWRPHPEGSAVILLHGWGRAAPPRTRT